MSFLSKLNPFKRIRKLFRWLAGIKEEQPRALEIAREGSDIALPVVYGKRIAGGVTVHKWSTNTVTGLTGIHNVNRKNAYLHMIVAFCHGEIDEFEQIRFDDEPSTRSAFNNNFFMALARGQDDQTAIPQAVQNMPEWTNLMRGRDVAYGYFVFFQDKDQENWGGEPQITALMRGKRVHDWRTDTYAYSENNAVCSVDYLRSTIYGRGLDDGRINLDAWTLAANFCDESTTSTVTVTEFIPDEDPSAPPLPERTTVTITVPRYKIAAIIDTDATVKQNFQELLASFRASPSRDDGRVGVTVEDVGAPIAIFDKSNIVGDINFSTGGLNSRFNSVTIRFPNERDDYERDEYTYPEKDDPLFEQWREEDNNRELRGEFEFNTLATKSCVVQMAEIIAKASRIDGQLRFNARGVARLVRPNDIIGVTDESFGWIEKPFRILRMKENGDGTFSFECQEHENSVYPWSGSEWDEIIGGSYLGDPRNVPAPTNLTLVDDGNLQTTGELQWSLVDSGFVRNYLVTILDDQDNAIFDERLGAGARAWTVPLLDVGSYTAQVRAVSSIGYLSPVVQLLFELAVPLVPVNLNLTARNFEVTSAPTTGTTLGLGTQFEFDIVEGDGAGHAPSKQARGISATFSGLTPGVQYTIFARTVNAYGGSVWVSGQIETQKDPSQIIPLIGEAIEVTLPDVPVFKDNIERIDGDIDEARLRLRSLETDSRQQRLTQEEANAEIIGSVADAALRREELRDKQRLNERLIDAVVEIDRDSGTIINKAFSYTDENFTQAQTLIDGVNGQVQLAVERISINEDEISDLNSELLLIPGQITATATSVSTNIVAEALAALQPAYTFNFFDSAQGWVAVNGTLSTTTASQIGLILGDIENATLDYDGEENPAIRIDIQRSAGDGWVGDVVVEFNDTTTETFAGIIEEPSGTTRVMRNLDFRGMQSYFGQINRIRLILGATTADEFIVRSITIGKADAQTQALAELSARVAQAELDIDGNTGAIAQRVTVTQYQSDQDSGVLITNSNFSQVLNADEGYGEIVGTYQQILADGTITKANQAGLFIGAYEGTFEAYVGSVQIQFNELGDEYATITFVNTELDAQRGTITDTAFRIAQLDNVQQDALINQTNALADYAAYIAGQSDVRINFARAINQLETDVSPEGALAQSITDLEASVVTESGRITATNTLLQQAIVDIEGNASSTATIASGITGESDEGQALLRLESLLNEGGLTTRAFFGTDNNGRVTGIIVNDDGNENTIAFQSSAVVFNDSDNEPAIFFDNVNQRYYFEGEIVASAGLFAGLVRGGTIAIGGTDVSPNFAVDSDGNVSISIGNINLGSGAFTVSNAGLLTAQNADITGKITSDEGAIGSWIIDTDTISSAASGARIVLDKPNNRIGVYDSATEKVAIGYLGGLPSPSGGTYASNQYGIFVAEGDEMVVDGRIAQSGGSWLVEEDASIRISRADESDIIRLGTNAGNKGLFLYGSSQNIIGEFSDSRIFFGDSSQFLQVQNGNITFSGAISNDNFSVSPSGAVTASNIAITGGSLTIGSDFSVTNAGALTATGATINGTITAEDGAIGSWEITSTLLRSATSGRRIELNPTANRVSVFDAVNEKVAMGYLGGLPKYDGSGNWSANDYGFWARQGDNLVIDGSIEYVNGDFLIENDATLKIQTPTGNDIIWLGTDNGEKGLFIYDGTSARNQLATFNSSGIDIGNSTDYLRYSVANGVEVSGKVTVTSGSVGTRTVEDINDDIDNAQTTASNAQGNLDGLINNLGDLAYADLVEEAQLGDTIIEGGFIKTGLLDVGTILGENAVFSGTLAAAEGTFAGAVRGGSIEISQQNNTGFFTYIDSTPFGTSGDLAEWYGEKVDGVTWSNGSGEPIPSGMSKLNAKTYKTVNGDVYFGGTFQAGTLSISRQATGSAGQLIVGTGAFTIPGNTSTLSIASSVSVRGRGQGYGACPTTLPSYLTKVDIELFSNGNWVNIGGGNKISQAECAEEGSEVIITTNFGLTANSSMSVQPGDTVQLRAVATTIDFPTTVGGLAVTGTRSLSIAISGG